MRARLSIFAFALVVAMLASAARAEEVKPAKTEAPYRHVPPPERAYTFADPQPRPTLAWAALQLVPSPQLGFGRIHSIDADARPDTKIETAWGLRWTLTPLLYSFGVHRRISPWRSFVVDPIARISGSIFFDLTFEYFGAHVDRVLARPGVHASFPVLHRGESLSFEMGPSFYQYGVVRVAYDAGFYILAGAIGLQFTFAPGNDALFGIGSLRLRFF